MKRILILITAIISLNLYVKAEGEKNTTSKPDYRYNWNFADIYSDWDQWDNELDQIKSIAPKFAEYKGTLGKSADALYDFFKFSEENSKIIRRLNSYVYLQRDLDSRNQHFNTKQQELQTVLIQISMNTTWYDSELASIPEETVMKWLKENKNLAVYKHDLKDFYRQQKHVLDEEKQNIVTLMSRALGASSRAYTSLSTADMVYPEVELSTGEKVTATPANLSKVTTNNPNQKDRLKVSNAYRSVWAKNKNTYTDIYQGILQNRWASAQLHNYPTCLDAVLESNNISKDVYMNLIEVASNNAAPLRKYIDLRKKALKLEKYYGSDGRVELVDYSKSYKWEEATKIVTEALEPMGKDYSSKLDDALQGGWIDVFEKQGKQTGAYSMGVYGVHPYILMNWADTRDNVFTLAHELGHALHSLKSNETQPYTYSQYPTMVAEVASTFNENMLLDYMLKNAKSSEEKISLLIQAIDNISGTFYRQAQFAEFEYKAYSAVEQNKPLNAEILASMYKDISDRYYGDAIESTKDGKYGWSGVFHFFQLYYYVYNYAVSYSASASLYDQVANAKNKKEAKKALERYHTLLQSGGSDYPVEMLKKAGVDLTTKDAFLAVTSQMTKLVDQLEEELKKIDKI